MGETATQAAISRDRQEMIDRRTVNAIFHMVDRFIPDACRREAMKSIMDIVIKDGLELTNREMRLQYEAWLSTQIEIKPLTIVLNK